LFVFLSEIIIIIIIKCNTYQCAYQCATSPLTAFVKRVCTFRPCCCTLLVNTHGGATCRTSSRSYNCKALPHKFTWLVRKNHLESEKTLTMRMSFTPKCVASSGIIFLLTTRNKDFRTCFR